MDEEQVLQGEHRPIIRIGDTVRRPTDRWSPAVHGLLKYLETAGFQYSPRFLGIDDENREILSYIDGESGKEGWSRLISDEGLRRFAKLLRAYHDAVAEYRPAPDSEWVSSVGGVEPGQLVCHGDFGPWNIVWNGEEPVGIVDWDIASPASPMHDVYYAMEYSVPFRDDEACLSWHHFPEVPDRRHRIEVFAKAYGLADTASVVDGVAAVQRQVGDQERLLAERGVQPQADWVAGGDLEVIEARAKWTENNRHLFE